MTWSYGLLLSCLQAAQLQAAKAVAEVDPEAPVAITAPGGGVNIGPAGSLAQAGTPSSPVVEASVLDCSGIYVSWICMVVPWASWVGLTPAQLMCSPA